MRTLLGIVAGLITAAAVWAGLFVLSIFVGGSECDRSDCNVLGEFFDEHWTITFILFLLFALFTGWVVGRAISRRRAL